MNFLDEANVTTNANDNVKQNIVTTGLLPEGLYKLCIEVYDYHTNALLSPLSTQGCASFNIIRVQPPVLNSPGEGQTVPNNRPTFNWTPPSPMPGGTQVRYKLTIFEVIPGQDANDAIRVNTPIVNRPNLIPPIYVTQPSDMPFKPGSTYAWQVQASDPSNKVVFINDGISGVATFKLAGGTGTTVTHSADDTGKVDKVHSGTVPNLPVCDCHKCEVLTPMLIDDVATNKKVTKDTLLWDGTQLLVYPPLILSDCPEQCNPHDTAEVRITYHYKRFKKPGSQWTSGIVKVNAEGAGYILFEARYRCVCNSKPCGNGIVSRKIYFKDRNNCCDSIREKNNGVLQFNFNGGSVKVTGNQMTVSIPPDVNDRFDFKYNLEDIFCNLVDDEVFGELVQELRSKMEGGDQKESYKVASLGMGNSSDFYTLCFYKTVNGKEMAIQLSIAKKKCSYDISVFYKDKIYDYTSPPFWTPDDLHKMGGALGLPGSPGFWNSALTILLQYQRARDSNMGNIYDTELYSFLQQLQTAANNLLAQTKDNNLKAKLKELLDAIRNYLKSPEPRNLKDVIAKFVPVANIMNNS